MRCPTIVRARPRLDSPPISRSRSSRGRSSPKCSAGSVSAPSIGGRSRDDSPALPRVTPKRRLALEIGASYACAWLVGIAYGFSMRSTPQWNSGASWERTLLRWFHSQQLPPWLDWLMLRVPLTGTNLTILPAMIGIGWWLWKRKHRGALAAQLLVVAIGS